MQEEQDNRTNRQILEQVDKKLEKYPTRWEMIAYLGGAVLMNRFVENATGTDVPKVTLDFLIGLML